MMTHTQTKIALLHKIRPTSKVWHQRVEWTATCYSDNCKIALQKFMVKACVLLMNKTIFKVQLFRQIKLRMDRAEC